MAKQPRWHKSLNDPGVDRKAATEEYLDRKLNGMSVKQLQELANSNDVDLDGATRKADIIERLKGDLDLDSLTEDDVDGDDGDDGDEV